MKQLTDFLTNKQARAWTSQLEPIFKQLPHVSKGLINILVSIIPWLVLLGAISSLFSGISMITSPNRLNSFSYLIRFSTINHTYLMISGVIQLIAGSLMLLAFNPLKNKKSDGWMYLFWIVIIGIIQSLLAILFGAGSILGLIISTLISFYIVYELKPSYK